MSDIRLLRPAAGTNQSVACEPEANFIFEFPTDAATLSRSGDDLVMTFEDGATLSLTDFYKTYSSENMPSFDVDGAQVAGADFFTAMNEPDLMPAAGPGGNNAPGGGRYHEYANMALYDGLDRLGGLDVGWPDGGYEPEIDGGLGLRGAGDEEDTQNGIPTIRPTNPQPLDPDTPVFPPDNPNEPSTPGGNINPSAGRDVLTVHEKHLSRGTEPEESSLTVQGSMQVESPDGVDRLEVGGRVVYENGEFIPDQTIKTDEGTLTVTGFDPETGELTYEYTLDDSSQKHDKTQNPDADDKFGYDIPVTVTDPDGDSASSTITVVIEDDAPDAQDDDAGTATEGGTGVLSGNVLDGTVGDTTDSGAADQFGADGPQGGEPKVHWDVPADWSPVEGQENTYHTKYGDITLHDDGSYEFKLADPKSEEMLELKGGRADLKVGYSITDADGDTDSAELTLHVQGVNHEVTIENGPEDNPGGGDGKVENGVSHVAVYESGLSPKGSEAGSNPTEAGNSFTVKAEDGLKELTVGGKTVWADGKLTDQNVTDNYGNTLHITDVTDNGNGTYTVTYDYTLKKATDKHNKNTHDASLDSSFDVVVTDADNDTAKGTITATVWDDAPTAISDHVTLGEGESVSGSVLHGTAKVRDKEGKLKDDNPVDTDGDTASGDIFGADEPKLGEGKSDPTVQWKVESNENQTVTENFNGSITVETKYGDVTLNPDGTYDFTASDKNNTLEYKEQGTLTFDYTITDKDGDPSQASLTITIEGNSTPDIPQAPQDSTNPHPDLGVKADSIIVDEAAWAAAQSNAVLKDGAGHTTHGYKAFGGFDVDLHGEGGDITLRYDDDTVNLHVEDGQVTFMNADGERLTPEQIEDLHLSVNGVKVHNFAATVDGDGKVHVTYEYELESAKTHENKGPVSEKTVDQDTLDGQISVQVKDGHGQDTATGYIDVQVHDDGPKVKATPDTASDTGSVTTGVLDMNFGADGLSEVQVDGKADALTVEVNGQVYYGQLGEGKCVFDIEGKGKLTIFGHNDEMSFDGQAHEYKFEPEDSTQPGSLDFTFVVKDGDGDTARANVTVKWTSEPAPEITVSDPSLSPLVTDDSYVAEQKDQSETVVTQPEGTMRSPVDGGDGNASSATTAPRTFTVETNGQACTLQISGGESGNTLTVTFDEDGNVTSYTLDGDPSTGWPNEGVIVHGQYGDLKITKGDGGQFSYTYTQTKNYNHSHEAGETNAPDESTPESNPAESFDVTLTYGDDGKRAYNGSIGVSIEDDEPIVDQQLDFASDEYFRQPDQAAVYQDPNPQHPNAHEGTVTLTGKVTGLNFGADGAKSVDIVMDGRTFHGELGTEGQWTWTDETGGQLQDGTVTFAQEGDTGTFTVTLPASEIENFSQTDAEGNTKDKDGNPIDDHTIDFTVRVTDGDGDTAEAQGQLMPPVADDDRTDVDMADFNVRVEVGDTLVHVNGTANIGDGRVNAHGGAGGAQFRDRSLFLMKAKEFTGGKNVFSEDEGTPSEYKGEIHQGEENENFFGRFFKDGNGNALTKEQLFSEHSANVYDFNIDEYIGGGKTNRELCQKLQEAAKYARENGQILRVYSESQQENLVLHHDLDFGDDKNDTYNTDLVVVFDGLGIQFEENKDLFIEGFLYVEGSVTGADDISVSGGMAVGGNLQYKDKLDARWYADDGLLMSKNRGITVTFGELLENDYDLDSTKDNVRNPEDSEHPHINREGLHILEDSIQLDPECEKDWTLDVNPDKGTVTVTPKPGCEPQTPPKFHYTVEDEHGLRDDASFDFDVYTLVEGHGGRLENPVETTDFHDIVVANSDGDPYVDYQPKSYNIGIVLDASSSMRPSGDLNGEGQINFSFVMTDEAGNLTADNLEDMFGSWNGNENSGTNGKITVKLGKTVLYWDGIKNHDSGTGTPNEKGEYNDAGNRLDFYEAYDSKGNGIGDRVSLYDDNNDGTYDRWRVYPSEKDDRASVPDEQLSITDTENGEIFFKANVSWHSRGAVLREALEGLLKQLGSYEGEITLYVSQFNNNTPSNKYEDSRKNFIWKGNLKNLTDENLEKAIEFILEQYETHSGTFYDEGFDDVFESFFGNPENLNPDTNAENHLYFLTDGSPNELHDGVDELKNWWEKHEDSVHLHMVGIGNDVTESKFDKYQQYADDVILVADDGDLNAALEELTESIIDFIPSMDVVDAGDGNDIVFGDAVGDLYAKLDYLVNMNNPDDERIPGAELERLEKLRDGLDLTEWAGKGR